MKTSWSTDYLHKKHGGSPRRTCAWEIAKLEELEKATGVKWTRWHEHGKIVFQPTWKGLDELADESAGAIILAALDALTFTQYGATFISLSETTNIPLLKLVRTGRWLVSKDRARLVLGRMTDAIGLAPKERAWT